MKKATFTAIAIMGLFYSSHSQSISNPLRLEQGQVFAITMDINSTISQVVMGQAIDLQLGGTANHSYKVTNATADNNTLHHAVERIRYTFEGMGQSRQFDSDNASDLESPVGPAIREVLKKQFDMVIDPSGMVLLVRPEKMEEPEMDDRMKLVANMLKDILAVAQPPQKGEKSFFKVLPDGRVAKGDAWSDSLKSSEGEFKHKYLVSEITDSTIIIDVETDSETVSQLEVMAGIQITTRLNNKSTGKIILDRATGIIREKQISTASHGTTEGMGGETPITSRSVVVVKVEPRN